MADTIIQEITKKGLDTYFKARQYEAMYWASFFPLKSVLSLNYTTLIGEQGSRVAADVISFDASAPEKTRRTVGKFTGDIPKTAVKRKMGEKEFMEYLMLKNMANADEQQILDLIIDDLNFVVDGVNARMEWLALQIISKTTLSLALTNNNGLVTEVAMDFQMPTANKTGASVAWNAGDKTTTKPITDIKAKVKTARAKGITLTYMLMHPDTFDDFVASTETQNYLKAFFKLLSTDVIPLDDLQTVNQALVRNRLPEIIVIDQSIGIEAKDGVITNVNPFDSNYVTFISSVTLGNMLNAPIAEELAPPKQVIQSKAGNVLVSKWSNVDPLAEWTKGEANVFPSWKNVDACYSMKVTATSWT